MAITATEHQYPSVQHVRGHNRRASHSPSEAMILQAAQQLTNPFDFPIAHPIDPSLIDTAVQPDLLYPAPTQYQDHVSMRQQSEKLNVQPGEVESQGASADGDTRAQDSPSPESGEIGTAEAKKKAANPKSDELRRLWRENETRSLEDVTAQLRQDLVDPQSGASDKSKHLFGMLWSKSFCRRGSEAKVARDLVYSQYTDACEARGVVALNHANFGKCVSTVYPNMKIRRLGPRGESKYNYWGLELVQTHPNPSIRPTGSKRGSQGLLAQSSFAHSSALSSSSRLPVDMAVFPSPTMATGLGYSVADAPTRAVFGGLFIDSSLPSARDLVAETNMVRRELYLPSSFEPGPKSKEDIDIKFPDIGLFMPSDTNQATVDELVAVYQSNCISSVGHFLSARRPPFHQSISFSSANMSDAARQLLEHPSMASWIEECDRKMYQAMVRCLPRLIFSQIPQQAVEAIQKISQELTSVISYAFASYPLHILDIKTRMAKVFASILERFVKVYETIQPVTGILSHKDNRDSMYRDWMTSVDVIKIAQDELPNCGYLEVIDILSVQIKTLLEPPSANPETFEEDGPGEPQVHTILERWGNLVMSLPALFPQAHTRCLITCTKLISMAAVQDLAARNCETFSHWWTMKLWLDELITFYAEAGGFLHDSFTGPAGLQTTLKLDSDSLDFHHRPTSVETELDNPGRPGPQALLQSLPGQQQHHDLISKTAVTGTFSTAMAHRGMGRRSAPLGASAFAKDGSYDDSGVSLNPPEEDLV